MNLRIAKHILYVTETVIIASMMFKGSIFDFYPVYIFTSFTVFIYVCVCVHFFWPVHSCVLVRMFPIHLNVYIYSHIGDIVMADYIHILYNSVYVTYAQMLKPYKNWAECDRTDLIQNHIESNEEAGERPTKAKEE